MAKNDKNKPEKEAPEAPKKPRAKAPPPEIPPLDTFKGVAKEEFEVILAGAKMLTEAYTAAEHVAVIHLREVRRAVNQALINSIRSKKKDPVEKQKQKLLRMIETAKAKLAEMGVE